MARRREYPPVTYGADYTHNLRWRYRSRYGEGSFDEPFRGGGSFGRGYRRAGWAGPWSAEAGMERFEVPPVRYGFEYRPGGRRPRRFRRPYRRPGTAARDYDRAYPYFGSAAAVEAAQGYPPGDTLNPETYPPRRLVPGWSDYREEY